MAWGVRVFLVFIFLAIAAMVSVLVWRFHHKHHLIVAKTYLSKEGVESGAVCLDGSTPVYHLSPGSGSGASNWIIWMEGGAWCSTYEDCLSRSKQRLGTSNQMGSQLFEGILDNSHSVNPDFYNWNRVMLRYCDGASWAGEAEIKSQNGSILYSRGERIFKSILSDLLNLKGMKNANKTLLGGCSAGGLGSLLHCNNFKNLLPKTTKVKCLGDAGYFLNIPDISGNYSFQYYFNNVVSLHNVSAFLPPNCTNRYGYLCFFPQYLFPYIRNPLFVLNSALDVWQIQNILVPNATDPNSLWWNCKMKGIGCTNNQYQIFDEFRVKFLHFIKNVQNIKGWGLFINSCLFHCQAEKAWNIAKLDHQTLQEHVGDWYFEKSSNVQHIENCSYPCDGNCHRFE